jgi:uncharacterized protein (TIGR02271 family)
MEHARDLPGAEVYGRDGGKIGTVGQVWVDNDTDTPEFATVTTGLFGNRETFVPLTEATVDGASLLVPYTKDQVKDAPRIEPTGELSQDEEAVLYRHYGLNYGNADSDSGLPQGAGGSIGSSGTAGASDDAMTLSEERLRVGTEKVETGRVRLRKYLVTEHVQQTVPVTKEKVRLEREPITDANVDQAMSGPELTESEHEVVLTEERPIVAKETVPVERVRLAKDTETTERTVDEEVRREEIDTDGTYPQGDDIDLRDPSRTTR